MLTLHQQQVQANSSSLSTASDLMKAQTMEYEQETDRIKELLSLSGLDLLTLDSYLGPALTTMAQVTSDLGLAGASLSNFSTLDLSTSLTWGQMAIDDAKATNRLLELQTRRSEIERCLKRAKEGSRGLNAGLDVARSKLQRSDQQLAQQVLPYHRDMPSKEVKYKELAREFKEELKETAMPLGLTGEGGEGVKEEVKHHALVAQHGELEAAQERLRVQQGKLEGFHGLPATQHGAEMLVAQAKQNVESMQRLLHNALGLQP